tara:strand:+ start:1407 stop:1697 length:291 start_codon:yes stop_codon:yes gene_type:complete
MRKSVEQMKRFWALIGSDRDHLPGFLLWFYVLPRVLLLAAWVFVARLHWHLFRAVAVPLLQVISARARAVRETKPHHLLAVKTLFLFVALVLSGKK